MSLHPNLSHAPNILPHRKRNKHSIIYSPPAYNIAPLRNNNNNITTTRGHPPQTPINPPHTVLITPDLSLALFKQQRDISLNECPDHIHLAAANNNVSDDQTAHTAHLTNSQPQRMTREERMAQYKDHKQELFETTSDGALQPKLHQNDAEGLLGEKKSLIDGLDDLTHRFRTQALGMNKQINQDKDTIDHIQDNVVIAQTTLEQTTDVLRTIVTSGWWDLFTNLGLFVTAIGVFCAVCCIIFWIPKAKWF